MSLSIEITNLTKSFRDNGTETSVLKGVNLVIPYGATLGIAGPSGAGKSTLLHIMGGLDAPTQGSVVIGGEDLFSKREKELCRFRNRMIGFVFQFHHLLPDFNSLENVAMPLLIRGEERGRAWARAAEMLERVGLASRARHRPAELSGGEQQRVAIARAVVGHPQIVLADEPTGNLDKAAGGKIFDLLLDINRELNTTLVVVSHNEELTRLLSRTVRMADGKIETPS